MIYAYLTDTSFLNPDEYGYLSPDEVSMNKLCVMDDALANYFVEHKILMDPRTQGVAADGRLLLPAPFNGKLAGKLALHFDISQYEEDFSAFTGDDSLQRRYLFSTIEYIMTALRQVSEASAYYPKTEADINTGLVSQRARFQGYQEGSISISPSTKQAAIRVAGQDGAVASTIYLPDYFIFKFSAGGAALFEFKVWLSSDAFKADYPFANITQIVYPCLPTKLLEMDYNSVVASMAQTTSYMHQQLSDSGTLAPIRTADHSGYKQYATPYRPSSSSASYTISFGILYKGRTPTSAQCRAAIKAQLKKDYPNYSDARWTAVLPGLSVENTFYIIPAYSSYVASGTSRYPLSIVNYKKLLDEVIGHFTLSAEQKQVVETYGAIIQIPGSRLTCMVFPEADNTLNAMDLTIQASNGLIPLYMAVDATSQYMDVMPTKTQDFNLAFAMAGAVALGTQSNAAYSTSMIDGREYLTFTSGNVEYHILTRQGYNQ